MKYNVVIHLLNHKYVKSTNDPVHGFFGGGSFDSFFAGKFQFCAKERIMDTDHNRIYIYCHPLTLKEPDISECEQALLNAGFENKGSTLQ